MWPSVPKLVQAKVLGTAYALIYWVQNLGLMLFKMLAGNILAAKAGMADQVGHDVAAAGQASGAVGVEIMFVAVCVLALLLALGLRRDSIRRPELRLDAPSRK